MMILQLLIICAEFGILLGIFLVVISMISALYSGHLDVPFVPTPKSAFEKIFGALDVRSGDVVYELGSGTGRLVRAAARRYPGARFIGIERNPLLYCYARMRIFIAGNPPNVTFYRGNFFNTDLSNATKLYMYLTTPVMNSLHQKFVRELKSARIVSRAFQFKEKQPTSIIELSKNPDSHGEQLLYVYDF